MTYLFFAIYDAQYADNTTMLGMWFDDKFLQQTTQTLSKDDSSVCN